MSDPIKYRNELINELITVESSLIISQSRAKEYKKMGGGWRMGAFDIDSDFLNTFCPGLILFFH